MGNLQLKLLASDDIRAAFLLRKRVLCEIEYLDMFMHSVGVHGIGMTGKACANLESYSVMNSTHG